eukprot:CAMPEP_0181358414 /NCGR_PEP_ID=MMETSP1106-20121128/5499_1 /TAXON_ID=81844 /ORGANISM="Mantoniella antarctica, Strain SL-175" /LENGTH=170 /DNA_ID=CAMNT_0023471377 /DNA_START=11 /DNA_END=523 /DNA_ORIENTATION=-
MTPGSELGSGRPGVAGGRAESAPGAGSSRLGGRSSGGGEVVPSVHATDLERGVEMLGARAGIVNTTAEDVRRSFQAHSGGAPSSSTHGHTSGDRTVGVVQSMDVNEVDALGVGAVVTSTTTKESRQLSSPANLGGEAAVDGCLGFLGLPVYGILFLLAHMKASEQTQLCV